VDVIYVGQVPFPLSKGTLSLRSPSIDVPLKEIHWELLLPGGYRYASRSRDLKQEASAEFAEASFSSLEYRRQDTERRAETRRESMDSLMMARYALTDGYVAKAAQMLSIEKQKGYQGEVTSHRMQEIESELTQVQARNLLQAERHFVQTNRSRNHTRGQPPLPAGSTVEEEEPDAYAEAQWRKVQESQRFSDSPPEPMRINLPTSGVKTTLTKALQAEAGSPLLMEMEVTHETRTGHWGRRAKIGILVLVLHGAVLGILIKRKRSREA